MQLQKKTKRPHLPCGIKDSWKRKKEGSTWICFLSANWLMLNKNAARPTFPPTAGSPARATRSAM